MKKHKEKNFFLKKLNITEKTLFLHKQSSAFLQNRLPPFGVALSPPRERCRLLQAKKALYKAQF
ncbi:MAG: hypothetical protein HDT46_01870 [Ruminococcaceae bacterium]|nr:hypothetical protein [Oscillospiraceae bacterium]